MSDYYSPESIVNEAMDNAGLDFVVGNLQEGTRPAQVALRKYTTCLHQLLRTAHWTFARREAPLQLIADASGQTPNVGTIVPSNFAYSYQMPLDAAKVRFIPANQFGITVPVPATNIVPSDSAAPLTTAPTQPGYVGQRIIPTRFLITSDPNYIPEGASNDQPGVTPIGNTVILSNQPNARCVYTYLAVFPNSWDALFRSAFVAFLASEIAMPLATDKRLGLQMRDHNIAIAKEKIKEARATNANETVADTTLSVDWMRVRQSGGYTSGYGWGGGFGPGGGYLFGGFDSIFFENSSAY